jgi:hypothetical protein
MSKLMSLASRVTMLNLEVWKSYSICSAGKSSLFRDFVLVGFLLVASFLSTAMPVAYAEDMYALEVGVGMTVTIDDDDDVLRLSNYTYELWLKDLEGPTGSWRRVFHKGLNNVNTGRGPLLSLRPDDPGLHFSQSTGSGQETANVTEGVPLNEWLHIALVLTALDGDQIIYQDGVEVARNDVSNLTDATQEPVLQIAAANAASVVLDDFRVWDYARTQEEIQADMNKEVAGVEEGLVGYWRFNEGEGTTAYDMSPYENHGTITDAIWTTDAAPITPSKPIVVASHPVPADGDLIEATWVNLSWEPGASAVSHDVYLGENFNDVDNGAGDTFRGNQTSTLFLAGFPGFAYPEGLVPGTTYYWRIDEVNEADPNSPWKGPVWSFSIAPKTAYNPDPADGAEFVDPNNVNLTWTPGFGAILHTAYFGDNYDEVNNATGGATLGSASYNLGLLEREKVYYWRVDEFDAVETHKGDVWSFTTPGAVGNPQPAYGAMDVQLNVILSWTPADSAASHELYLGMDKEAVRNADTGAPEYKDSKSFGDESYDPGLLEPETSYYWRVDEVDGQGNTAKGPLWIFTTGAFLLVDDFESYTDDDPNNQAIWQTWIDGFGVPDNGAQVGYLLPPYAEQRIVHGGGQSMPLLYVNEAGVTNSETSMTLTAPRDWTQANVAELSLWIRAASDNAEDPLYVAVSNSAGVPAVVAHDDPAAAANRTWSEWRISLQAFADQGINLSNVERIAIGLGSTGGAAGGGLGTIYIDDIRLYRPRSAP